MTSPPSDPSLTGFAAHRAEEQTALERRLQDLPSSRAFRKHLVNLTCAPHPAGTVANVRVGEYAAGVMEQAGLDVVRYAYDAYMPEPGADINVALVTPVRLPLNNQEYILKEDRFSNHPDLMPGWTAYSGSDDVTGEVVYANYGTLEDFQQLKDLSVALKGKIVIARYGGNFRGFKVKYAQEAGAVGVILYSDPADGGYVSGPVYPEGRFLNESAVQRGSLLTLAYPGDPLTPLQPALTEDAGKNVTRLDPADVSFHKIPVAPLPYGSAVEILKRMAGQPVPSGWQGGLPFTYRITGGPDLTVRVRVNQPLALTRATNVIGTLQGSEFPDEWIILGCHYDAWGFGTVDPNSGTAVLLTLAEALGQLAKEGHRPRRTIKIAHWDAEEYAIIGSTEWVEQFRDELTEKAVAYINADMAASGPNFSASASPSLVPAVIESAKAVAYPGSDQTVHAHWLARTPDKDAPAIGNLGGGSDHMGFYMHIGVPSSGLSMSGPSAYHTNYDNMAWYERFSDADFVYGPAVARVDGVLALRLANADALPYGISQYAADLERHIVSLEERAVKLDVTICLDALKAGVSALSQSADAVETARDRWVEASAADLQRINRALIGLEKVFIHPDGLQGRPWSRSLYAADDPFSGYASWMLPGLRYEVETRSEDGVRKWEGIYVNAVKELTRRIREIGEMV